MLYIPKGPKLDRYERLFIQTATATQKLVVVSPKKPTWLTGLLLYDKQDRLTAAAVPAIDSPA